MILLYRLALFFYASAINFASNFKPKAKLFIEGRKDILLKINTIMASENRPRIWMHCASLGEFEQGRPILDSLRNKYPNYALILTFFSPSGYEAVKEYTGVDYVFYLPLDSPSNARQFISYTHPSFSIFVKYDLWYFYLNELYKNGIPVVLIDAIFRKQQGYFKWYGTVQRKMLQILSHVFVQNTESEILITEIGIKNVSVAGDTRFDRVLSASENLDEIENLKTLSQKYKLLIAGSTWAADEQLLANFLPSLPSDWKLIIVPHEVDANRILSIEKLFLGKTKKWSDWQMGDSLPNQVLVVDSIGVLFKIYQYGSLAWIGGGLGISGVHNVLEAAVYGLPCAFGPVYHKYREAIELIAFGGARSCKNSADFLEFFNQLLNDSDLNKIYCEAAKNYVNSNAGATSIIINYFEEKKWLKMV